MYSFNILIFLFFNCERMGRSVEVSTAPVRISSVTMPREKDVCPAPHILQSRINTTKQEIGHVINDIYSHPCEGTGWTRVAFLNMSQSGQSCPSNFTLISSQVRGCGRKTTEAYSCDSVIFSVPVKSYHKVCGVVLAYQWGATDAFWSSIRGGHNNIEKSYVDGLSLTYGPAGSRHHIWTFAAAHDELNGDSSWNCACTNTQINWPYTIPSFIGNNYFCDTGRSGSYAFYSDNLLWDGKGCGTYSTCCQHNNPPWFHTTLPRSTSEDIELRLCNNGDSDNSDVIVHVINIYVK